MVNIKPNNKTDLTAIEAFEAAVGKKLPEDYRRFLLFSNGGKPENNEFSIPDEKNAAGIDRFYGLLGEPKSDDLLHQYQLFLDRIPMGILPIADASGGNLVCLSLCENTLGYVYFWDHELESEEGVTATFSNLFLVGSSFDNFLAKLKSFDSSQVRLKPGQVKKAWVNPDFLKSLKEKK
jgi:hypothetical protein